MYNQLVFDFEDDDNEPRYRVRPQVRDDALEDHIVILIDPTLAERAGVGLDDCGFPTSESLETWHGKHNPQLFTD